MFLVLLRMLQKVYNKLQLLSIDVAIGACSMSYLVSEILEVSTPLIIYLALGSSVWLTYTMDHILDANSNTKVVITPRHTFHKKFFKELIGIWLLVFILTAISSLLYFSSPI